MDCTSSLMGLLSLQNGKSICPPAPPPPLLLYSLLWGIGYHGLAGGSLGFMMTWMGVPWLASLAIALFCLIFIISGSRISSHLGSLYGCCWSWPERPHPRLHRRCLWCAQPFECWTAVVDFTFYTQSPHNSSDFAPRSTPDLAL